MAKAAETKTAKTERAPLADGDVIRLDYTLWVDGKMVDTSLEEQAKAGGVQRQGKRYQPLTVTLGSRQIIPGLESHIRSHGRIGEQVEVEIAPEDAYGARDPQKIKDVPMAQFKAQKVTPEVGMGLTYQGERGVVTRVAGGRVRVDLNHDLAGKTLRYTYKVTEHITDAKGKVEAVLASLFPAGSYKLDVGADAVTVEVPDQVKFDQNWTMAKFMVVSRVREAAGKDKAIRLVETYPAPKDMPDVPAEEPGHEGHGHGPGEHHH